MGTMTSRFVKTHFHLLLPAFFVLILHLFNNAFTTYGIFRDELYYIACSEHLAWGYVDQPPLCVFVLAASRFFFGDSVFALRIVPSLAHALTVVAAGILTKKLGGEKFAQVLSAITVSLAPGIIGMMGIYSMNASDILLWQCVAYFLIRLFETHNQRYWYAIGVFIGIGLLNKISMGWFAAGIAVGIVATPQRQVLKKNQPWIAAGIALLIFLPFIMWNVQNNFAHLEFARNAARLKYASQNPVTFLSGLAVINNPFAIPVWLAGFWILMKPIRKEFRVLGIAMITVLIILLINYNTKSEYFTPAAIILLAAGAVGIERWFTGKHIVLRYSYVTILVVSGVFMMPMAIDILPVQTFISYSRAIGVQPPNTEGHRMGDLPQHFADRFGWRELVADVAGVFNTLSPEERNRTAIFVHNYGEAGAIDFYGEQYGLPKALCGHNNYWIWGNDRLDDTVEILIAVGGEATDYHDTFEEITQAGTHVTELAMRYESDLPIYVCRKPKLKIKEVWHTTREYI
jgi:hypothetical protein